jgi:hypothetical protein
LHHDDVTEGIGGTDGSVILTSQTGVQTPVAGSEITLVKSKTTQSNQFKWVVDQLTATDTTFREFSTRNISNLDYDRSVFPGVNHTENDQLVIIKTFFYRQG